MTIRIDIAWLIASLLLSLRIGGALLLAPVLGATQIPAVAKVVVVIALSSMMVAFLPALPSPNLDVFELAGAALGEGVLGAAFAFGFIAAYGAAEVAGRILDIQMGFGAASILNPATQTVSPLMGNVLGMVAIMLFLGLNGHHVLLQALAVSIQSIPLGEAFSYLEPARFLRHSVLAFSFGLVIAAPVMFALLLADVALAVCARSMPQLNVFAMGFAIKILLGLTGLALSIKLAESAFTGLFERVFDFWEALAGG